MVAKTKIDNDPQYKYVADHRKPLQTHLAQELHKNAGVTLGPCGLEEVKNFQCYFTDYQINIASKDYGNKIIYNRPEKEKQIYLYMHNNHNDVITKMPGFYATAHYFHVCKKADNNRDHPDVRIRANIVGFLPFVLKSHGLIAANVTVISRVKMVSININNLEAMQDPCIRVW